MVGTSNQSVPEMAIDEFLGSTMNYGYEKIALGMT
jgi:hypothetical protein